jgi:hypothetical protein
MDDGRLAIRADFADLAVVAGCHPEIAGFILDDVPHMRRFQIGQQPKLPRQPQHSFTGHDSLFQLGLVEILGPDVLPDFDLGSGDRIGEKSNYRERYNEKRYNENCSFHETVPESRCQAPLGNARSTSSACLPMAKSNSMTRSGASRRCVPKRSLGTRWVMEFRSRACSLQPEIE